MKLMKEVANDCCFVLFTDETRVNITSEGIVRILQMGAQYLVKRNLIRT